MYNSVSIANYFINKSFFDGVEITPMKILKLVYIAHGWHLGIFKKPLITEQTEAWKYGPVVPTVYSVYKKYRSGDIDKMAFPNDFIKSEYEKLSDDDNTKLLLDKIWDVYKGFSGGELSDLTHQNNSPWDITWNKNNGSLKQGAIIPNKLIQEYYQDKLAG